MAAPITKDVKDVIRFAGFLDYATDYVSGTTSFPSITDTNKDSIIAQLESYTFATA